jgi:hypothetical protein
MSYMTQASYEAECDDPSLPGCDLSIFDMARPQVARLTSKLTDAWLTLCKLDIEEDLKECELDCDRTGDMELEALEAWREARAFTGSYWDYQGGAIYPTDDGRFLAWGTGERFDTLAKAEKHAFYQQVLPTITVPTPPAIELVWRTEGWITPEHGRVHQVYECYWGEELMAVMVIQQLEDDLA